MQGWLKLLVLATVPILAVTMVADQGLAADKGSQLIFQSDMAHHNFISVVNTSGTRAVTVLTQYYNNEMEMALWYLRVIAPNTTVLVDPFNHTIPGPDEANAGDAIMASGKMGNGHFVIAITAVGANVMVDHTDDNVDNPTANTEPLVNVLFPDFLAEGMHKTGNIDECGQLWAIANVAADATADPPAGARAPRFYTENAAEDKDDCDDSDNSSKNVGGLTIDNAQPIAFNHLTGHFTEALVGTDAGGGDQTASWGGTPVVRPAVLNRINAGTRIDYTTLNGMDTADANGGQLAEMDAGGKEVDVHDPDADGTGHTVAGFLNAGDNKGDTAQADPPVATDDQKITNGERNVRGLNDGALVLTALHGGGAETEQTMLLLSVADEFGGAGKYSLVPAMTGYMIIPMDQMGNPLDMEAAADPPKFGSGAEDEDADTPSAAIIVNGISVMANADLGECTGTAIDGPWTVSHLTGLIPEASTGGKDFAGLDAMIDPMMNAAPGWVKIMRSALTCKKDYGDGDSAALTSVENADGVPVSDERTYTAGTLIVEENSNDDRAFVTTGRALLKFITSDSTFAASWTLKSPASGTDATAEDGDLTN